jgi:hypothetical protein
VLVSSYTHPEYAASMAATLALTGQRALLLRGTEGEVVADARRTPEMTAFLTAEPALRAERRGPAGRPARAAPNIDAATTAATSSWCWPAAARAGADRAPGGTHLAPCGPPADPRHPAPPPDPGRTRRAPWWAPARRPRAADPQGAQGLAGRHRAAGGRPGQRRDRGPGLAQARVVTWASAAAARARPRPSSRS